MMIFVFLNETKKTPRRARKAEAASDEPKIWEQTHAVKSCAGTFGGKKLQTAAQELEDLASHSNACSDGAAITRVRQVAGEAQAAYADYNDYPQAS
ncbi:Hpt domain-containing protein [Marinobacter alexandrii]|uniref:Hpt domain-containing protein n=1 Tax=Marinobacter alexandrii TaxID=2570351 RepID=UPI0011080927|nr:Hpt domain-containing protein [Marinobacter alexandrii]